MSQSQAVSDSVVRILVVDDEAVNRELLEIILSWEGFGVVTAASGAEALACVAQVQPDLVLLDLMMPGMNGYEVTNLMKANHATEHIPIIIVTAMGDRSSRARALSAGAVDVLTKPTERAELCARVRRVLSFGTRVAPPVLRIVTPPVAAEDVHTTVVVPPSVVYGTEPERSCETGGKMTTPVDMHVQAATQLLLAHSGASEDGASATAGRVYAALFESLAPVIGEAGVRALFERSLKLTQAGFAWLEEIQVTAEPIASRVQLEAQVVACLSKRDAASATATATAVYATFLRLLTDFIGDSLVRQIVKSAFPIVEPAPKENS
jgi:CheY-like chemotaxis protein